MGHGGSLVTGKPFLLVSYRPVREVHMDHPMAQCYGSKLGATDAPSGGVPDLLGRSRSSGARWSPLVPAEAAVIVGLHEENVYIAPFIEVELVTHRDQRFRFGHQKSPGPHWKQVSPSERQRSTTESRSSMTPTTL